MSAFRNLEALPPIEAKPLLRISLNCTVSLRLTAVCCGITA